MIKKIGIFAGTFDPVHDGHIALATTVTDQIELDKLFFMVEEHPWSKKQPVLAIHRRAMVDLAIAKLKKVNQLDLPDQRFSIQLTLPKIIKAFPDSELFFIFGADVFMGMNDLHWQQLDKLLQHKIVVVEREGTARQDIVTHAEKIKASIYVVQAAHPQHKSSDVRLRPQQKTLWVPLAVADYIEQHNLY